MSWEALKEEGNKYFRAKDYSRAIELYTKAIGNLFNSLISSFFRNHSV